jgi:hypothetical protein
MKQIALLVLSCLTTFTCLAFEANGFKTGMSIERAKQVVSSKSMNVRGMVIDGRTSNTGGFEQFSFFNDTAYGGVLAFCNDKLFFYSHSVDFDLDFANALEKMLDHYGQPTSLKSYRSDFNDKPLLMSQIDFVWKKADDEITSTVVPEKKSPDGKILVSRIVNISYKTPSLFNPCFK